VTPDFFIFTRVYAKEGQQHLVSSTIQDVLRPTRQESGCLDINAFASTRDPRLFHIHSRWNDEAAFDLHLQLPHTRQFLDTVKTLIDGPMEVTRAQAI
jgi:quinol monooxygenase YgiN